MSNINIYEEILNEFNSTGCIYYHYPGDGVCHMATEKYKILKVMDEHNLVKGDIKRALGSTNECIFYVSLTDDGLLFLNQFKNEFV